MEELDNSGTDDQVTPTPDDTNPLLGTSEVKVEAPEVVEPPKDTPAPSFPEQWRQLITKDEKELTRLQRFTTPEKLWESYRQLETKVSSGKFKPELPENATPEQLTEYRKSIGVPAKHEDYFTNLPEGVVIGEEDKPAFNLLAERLHEKNVTPDVFNTVMQTTFELIELNQQEAVAAQLEVKEASRQALYEKWGPAEYKVNTNAIANLLAGMPESLRARMTGAQLSDGNLMFNDTEAMLWWAQHIRDNNPAMGVMPAGTGDVAQGIEAELAANRQAMRTPSEWFSKNNLERRQRHTQLLETLEKMKRKA